MDPDDPTGKAQPPSSPLDSPARELRVAVTVDDFEAAVRFYRDALGLPVVESWDQPGDRRGVILAAGQATLELLSTAQTELVDQVEAPQAGGTAAQPDPAAGEAAGREPPGGRGDRPGPPVRLAIEVADSAAAAEALVASGAEHLGGPVVTPWLHRNVRLRAPDGMQLTLFTVLDPDDSEGSPP
jgi:catechol 2,3-dioxygenase-like lactoylglutathione lyase family enzyme